MAVDFGTPRRGGGPSEPYASPPEGTSGLLMSQGLGGRSGSPRLGGVANGFGGYPLEGGMPGYTGSAAGLAAGSATGYSPRLPGMGGGSGNMFAGAVREPPEVARRAAEWERQIETLDQKEMEIHQTQLRLIREQTTTFRGDLLALQQELVDLKALVLKHGAMHGDLANKVEGRISYTERGLKDLHDNVGKHAQLHQDSERKLSNLAEGLGEHQRTLSQHGTMKERMDYVERLVGDSFDKHQRQLEDAHAKLEQLHGRLSNCEVGHGDLKKANADRDVKHATVGERLAYIEQAFGDSADKHMRELDNVRNATERQMRENQARHGALEQTHATVQQRLQVLENAIGDSADRHQKELQDVKLQMGKMSAGMTAHATVADRLAYLEQVIGDSVQKHQQELFAVHGRLDKMAGHASALDDLHKNHNALAKDLASFAGHHASQNERIAYLEQVLGDSVEKHNRELETVKAAHNKLAGESKGHGQNHAALGDQLQGIARSHASVEERVNYLERMVGDSVEKHAREIQALKTAHAAHANGSKEQMTRHASLEERVDYIEKSLGDSADKHAAVLAAQQAKLEHLHGKLQDQDKNHAKQANEVAATKDRHEQLRASVEDRLAYIEKAVGESLDKNYREIDQIKGAHAKLAGDGKQVQVKHASLDERINYIESWFKGFKGQ